MTQIQETAAKMKLESPILAASPVETRNRALAYMKEALLAHQEETGIDYTTDTYDAGQHLNLAGAEKASAWFGKILAEQPGVTDRRDDAELSARWDEKIAFYEAMKASQEKQLAENGAVTSFR